MKKYQFKLDAVLKLRKLKEENCRTELGLLNKELELLVQKIASDKEEIGKYYEIQELALKTGAAAGKLQTFPALVEAKEKNIQIFERKKRNHEDLIVEKKQELAVLRGELKVMDNLKEKDFTEWKKAYNKDVDQKVEEQTQIWLAHRKKAQP